MSIALSLSLTAATHPDLDGGPRLPVLLTSPSYDGPWIVGGTPVPVGTPTALFEGAEAVIRTVQYRLDIGARPGIWGAASALSLDTAAPGDAVRLFLRVDVESAPGIWSPVRLIAEGIVTEASAGGQAITASHRGASFTVSNITQHGTYLDGSPWVVQGALLTAATPAATTFTGTIEGVSVTDADMNGLQRNPGQANNPIGTLANLQNRTGVSASTQGWDGRVTSGEVNYNPTRNLDPGKTGQPVALDAPMSLVKARSTVGSNSFRNVIEDFGVLTVVANAPAHADACRPAVASPDKTSRWRLSDIVLPAENVQTYAGMRTYSSLKDRIGFLQHMINTDNTQSRGVSPGPAGGDPEEGSGYAGDMAEYAGQAFLWLIVGGGTEAERRDIAGELCQMAEDVRGRALQGGIWNNNGGWSHMGEMLIRIGEALLPGRFADALALTIQPGVASDKRAKKPVGRSIWGETQRVAQITQGWIDISAQHVPPIPYTAKQIGWPEWEAALGTHRSLPNDGIDDLQILNSLYAPEFVGSLPSGYKPQYRHITNKGMVPTTLALHWIGSPQIAADQTYFDYIDRYMHEVVSGEGNWSGMIGGTAVSNLVEQWVIEAWKDLRDPFDIWAGWPVHAIIGQSENVIGIFSNLGNNRQNTYVTLLPGVDAYVSLRANNEVNYSGERIFRLDRTTVIPADVNPGFVALANLWHAGSGGVPLRVIDLNQEGTSMQQMLDDDNAGRNFASDAASVRHGSVGFGSVTDVYYNWWNSESSVAKTLQSSRYAHFFGRNVSGTEYDFATGSLEHCLIDTTGRGFGLLPPTARVHMFYPGPSLRLGATEAPERSNYDHTAGGNVISDQTRQLEAPTHEVRRGFLAAAPEANRGKALIAPIAVRFGDMDNGVKHPSGQGTTHPSIRETDGQLLYAQDVGAGFLIARDYVEAPAYLRTEWATDGSYADFVFRIPAGSTLTTQRIRLGQTVASPRPHQQEVMGFVVYRGGDTAQTSRVLYRTDATAYPAAYRGTAVIQDTGTDAGGQREARVRITPVEAFVDGDQLHWGMSGNYGEFYLGLFADHDARMYRDCLRAYLPGLDVSPEAPYPGIPVPHQHFAVASGITGAPVDPPADPPPPPPPVNAFATKAAGSNAYLRAPVLPANTAAFTASFDIAIANGSQGSFYLLSGESQFIELIIDTRSGKREMSSRSENDATGVRTRPLPADPVVRLTDTTRGRLTWSATHDNGSGLYECGFYWNGSLLVQKYTGSSLVPARYPNIRALDIFSSTGAELTLYGLDIWHRYTGDGSLAGLGTPVHSVSGDASVWNNPTGTGLTKQGAGLFT